MTRLAVPKIRGAVRQLRRAAPIARCAMTDLELGFSARNSTEWDRLCTAAAAFNAVEMTPEDFRRAGQVQRMLAGAGLKGRKVPDLLIAAAAERTYLTLLHYDRDFEHIANVTGQAQQWVVPAGSVD